LHQLILPFTDRLAIGPLGGFGSFAPLAPYEALLREAIGACEPLTIGGLIAFGVGPRAVLSPALPKND